MDREFSSPIVITLTSSHVRQRPDLETRDLAFNQFVTATGYFLVTDNGHLVMASIDRCHQFCTDTIYCYIGPTFWF